MEGGVLLEREARFRQMNQQLEQKSQILIQHIESAMQRRDTFAEVTAVDIVDLHRCGSRGGAPPAPGGAGPARPPPTNNKALRTKKPLKPDSNCKFYGSSVATGDARSGGAGDAQHEACCCLSPAAGGGRDAGWDFLSAFVGVSVREGVLPESFVNEPPAAAGVCKFLAGKVRLLHEQVGKLQAVIDKKAAQCERHLRASAELEGERLRLRASAGGERARAERLAGRALELARRLEESERRGAACRGERDRLEAELRAARGACAAAEARREPLERAAGELRRELDARVAAHEESRGASRRRAAERELAAAALEARGAALLAALERYRRLVENLRAQRRLLAAELAAGRTRADYRSLLERGAGAAAAAGAGAGDR